MGDPDPSVTVVVPARDAQATLGRTLRALLAQDIDEPYEVIVVDAGSADATARIARSFGTPVRLIEAPPEGPADARNRGARAARAARLAFTDADCFPDPGWLRAGVGALAGAQLVQGRVTRDPQTETGPFDRTVDVVRESGLYESANLFVGREDFERAGGFHEWLRPTIGAPHMGEDVLFGWRVRRGGGVTAFCSGALVHHAVFRRGLGGFVGERRRLRYFADLADAVPELRGALFFGHVFLSRRTAAFDLALAGAAVAAWRRSPLPIAAAGVYVVALVQGARPWGRMAPKVAVAHVLADAVGCYSLVLGSLRRRAAVL